MYCLDSSQYGLSQIITRPFFCTYKHLLIYQQNNCTEKDSNKTALKSQIKVFYLF